MTEPMKSETRFDGTVASEGLAIGPVIRLERGPQTIAPTETTTAVLDTAVAAAASELESLMAEGDDLAGEIIGFQLALLQDPELTKPAHEAISTGTPPLHAWSAAIDPLIASYAEDEEEYFQARADDLRDLKQRIEGHLVGSTTLPTDFPEGAVLVTEGLSPTGFLEIDFKQVGGAALAHGSATSHMAMLARAKGVPLLTGLGESIGHIESGTMVILDARNGCLIVDPSPESYARYSELLENEQSAARHADAHAMETAHTADGTPIDVLINVDDPRVLEGLDPAICDGIGLTRTEFLFTNGMMDETTQEGAYRRILSWPQNQPVVIRTLDAGGDKPIPGITPEGESNPFLGLRGLRLSLAKPEPFRLQLRALLRAAPAGDLRIMLPMVTFPYELEAARHHLESVLDDLKSEGGNVKMPALGIMVETPAAALNAKAFDADFYSIGTNDLIQYVTAAARDIDSVANLHDALSPPVLGLIRKVVEAGEERGVPVSVCGEMAARIDCLGALLKAGVRTLSVPPAAVGRVKQALAAQQIDRIDG